MALVSYTQTAAGEPMQFTMNKTDLLAVPKVMADPFFYLESNWFRVSFVFKHTTSGKRFVPSFRTFTSTKYLRVREGMNGGDGFELKKIIISKSDRTFLVIKTSEIPSVANYTFSLIGSGGGGGNNASGFYAKNFSDALTPYEFLLNTYNPNNVQQPSISDGALSFYSNYNGYGFVFRTDLDLGNKLVEADTTYKIKLTGSASAGSQMHFKFGRNLNNWGDLPNAVMKDAQGSIIYNTVFTNGEFEFYVTTDSTIVNLDEFHQFSIFLDWSYAGSAVSITNIEITKV